MIGLRVGVVFATCLAMSAVVCAQGVAGVGKNAGPVFEIATIKPTDPNSNHWGVVFHDDGVTASSMTLRELVQEGYGVYQEDLLVGGPKWIGVQKFDVAAKVGGDEAARFRLLPMKQRQAVLLKLLVDRFSLVVHQEMRELPIYALVVDSHGPKLHSATPEHLARGFALFRGMGRGTLDVEGASTEDLASALNDFVPHTVVDRTGITGRFDISLRWRRDDLGTDSLGGGGDSSGTSQADTALPSLFTALQEELGLKLVPQKSMMPVLVIDNAAMPAAD